MAPASDAVELLSALVRVPSVTGDTAAVQIAASRWLTEHGVESTNTKDGLVARVGKRGPALLLLSHLDTVPPGSGWTFDPCSGDVVNGRLRGRGATDAKGSAAAMAAATAALAADKSFAGSVILYLSSNEEGDVPAAPRVIPTLGPLAAAIVGEPTELNVGVAQRGLLVVELIAEAEQGHAAYSTGKGSPLLLAEDLVRVCGLEFPETDPRLGGVKITPVRLSAGVADNVTPPTATAMFDIRTIPAYPHDRVLALVREACRHGRVEKVGTDWPPVETPEGHPLLALALEVTGGETRAGRAASDWAFLGDVPAVKIGPGDSGVSHRPDEDIDIEQVRRAARVYADLARRFAAGAAAA